MYSVALLQCCMNPRPGSPQAMVCLPLVSSIGGLERWLLSTETICDMWACSMPKMTSMMRFDMHSEGRFTLLCEPLS